MALNQEIYWKMLKKSSQQLSGCKIVHTGIASPWLNGVIAGVADDVDQIIDSFKKSHTPFCWWSDCRQESATLMQDLEKRGLIFAGAFESMTLDLEKMRHAQKKELQVEIVSSTESLAPFMKVLCEVYEAPDEVYKPALELFASAGLSHPTYHFMGLLDDQVVTVGSLYLDEMGVASVFNMGTLAAYRKKGYASQALSHALQKLSPEEAKSSELIATPEGINLYQGLGYEKQGPFHLYMHLA